MLLIWKINKNIDFTEYVDYSTYYPKSLAIIYSERLTETVHNHAHCSKLAAALLTRRIFAVSEWGSSLNVVFKHNHLQKFNI